MKRPTKRSAKPRARRAEKRERSRAPLFLALAATAGAGFVMLARAVERRDTAVIDEEVHEATAVPEGEPAREAAEASNPVGKWWTYVPVAALTAAYVIAAEREDDEVRGRVAGGVAIVVAALIAANVNHLFDHLLPQPPAPPGRPKEHPVFPSGHAFGTTTVAIAAATVLTREDLAPAFAAFPLALLVPAVTSAARLMEEKHWISDIVGGYLAAIVAASLPLAVYEGVRKR